MRKISLLLTIAFFTYSFVSAQNIYFHGGAVLGENNLESLSPYDLPHSGYRVGVDMGLNKGLLYLIVGGQFMKYDFNPTLDSFMFQQQSPQREFVGRVGVGLNILHVPKLFKLRAKLLGNLHYADVENESILIPEPYTDLQKTYAGISGGVGITILYFTLDVEYEKGIKSAIEGTTEATFDFLYLTAGLSF